MNAIQRRELIEKAMLQVQMRNDGLITISDKHRPHNCIRMTQYDIVSLPFVNRQRTKASTFSDEQLEKLLEIGLDEEFIFTSQERLNVKDINTVAEFCETLFAILGSTDDFELIMNVEHTTTYYNQEDSQEIEALDNTDESTEFIQTEAFDSWINELIERHNREFYVEFKEGTFPLVGYIRIKSEGFHGICSQSPNGKYIVAWHDGDDSMGVGGSRYGGEGEYLLLEEEKVVLRGKMQRPNDGIVADNGTFILHDWLFGGGLNGRFYAFDRHGKQLVKHFFYANLSRNAVSRDGRYALCTTGGSNNRDGIILAFFDLVKGRLLWQKQAEVGGQIYEINSKTRKIELHIDDFGVFRFDFCGKFLDEDSLKEAKLRHGHDAVNITRQIIESGQASDSELKHIISLLQEALLRQETVQFRRYEIRDQIYRAIGEIHEHLENVSEAIVNYNEALEFNPKVGVKLKVQRLQKKIN